MSNRRAISKHKIDGWRYKPASVHAAELRKLVHLRPGRRRALHIGELGALLLAVTSSGMVSGCAGSRGPAVEATGRVVWMGQISETKGPATVGMHASATRHVVQDAVRILVDGHEEPLLYTGHAGGKTRALSEGDRVHVKLRKRGGLFGANTYITSIKKLEEANTGDPSAR